MNVLMLTDEPPSPGPTTSPQRYFHLIRSIARRHQVTLVCLSRSQQDLGAIAELKRGGANIEVIEATRNKWMYLYHCLKAMIEGQPPVNGYSASTKMHQRLRRLTRESRFDIIHLEHAHMAQYLRSVMTDGSSKSLLFMHNIGPVMYERNHGVEDRFLRRLELWLCKFLSKRWEPRICRRFDQCVVFSEEDREHHLSLAPASNTSVIPLVIDVQGFECLAPAFHEPGIVFIGSMEYAPNRDGVRYFCREIFPLILAQRKDARFHIVGRSAPDGLDRFVPLESLDLAGYVQDAVSVYRRCAISIVPLRAGSGVRGKILESMALGRPVVTTSMGCEGLKVTHGTNIWIADTPEDFAQGVLRLISDKDLWIQLAENGRRFVEENHDCEHGYDDVLSLYENLLHGEAR